MATGQYFVNHEGHQMGPFSLDQIVTKVKSNELTVLDYLYDEQAGDWVLLMEYQELALKLKDHKPAAPPRPAPTETQKVEGHQQNVTPITAAKHDDAASAHMVAEWYVLKGENKFGPFAYTDMIRMLQQKVVFEFDFGWHAGMSTWKRVADIDAFSSHKIDQLRQTLMPEIEEVFFRRRHRRVSFGGTVLVHDNKTVWKGEGVEISAGGAGVVMENAMIVPGQSLYLHFKPCDGVPPFNAICEVVSKKYEDGVKERNAPIRYGLKFTSISENAQKFLQEYSKREQQAA